MNETEFKPRQEVISWIEEMVKSSSPHVKIIAGFDEYTPKQITDQVKKGTEFGQRMYAVLEKMYERVQQQSQGAQTR